jgi:predicted GNAT family N-acyltransferase
MNTSDFNELQARRYGPGYAVEHPEGGRIWLRPARADEIGELHTMIALEIASDVGPVEAMQSVFARNPDSFWAIERSGHDEQASTLAGMYGFLPLTEKGCEALRMGALDRRTPQLDFVAPAGMKPAGLYVWAIVARRIRKLVYPLIKQALGPLYADVPVFAIPATRGGAKAVEDRGYVPVAGADHSVSELAMLPIVRTPTLKVVVASNADHLQMAAFIRGATFGAEQHCPYAEEFDENDYCAMHLIGFVGEEPSATLRIRFFASFAKLERLAVIERFRKTDIKTAVMDKAIDICRRKGYARLYGQSQERLVGFYAKFGFRPMQKNRPLVFSDHAYVEIESDLDPHESAVTIDSDPYTIIRPEGRWDVAGVLERSAERPATNPY